MLQVLSLIWQGSLAKSFAEPAVCIPPVCVSWPHLLADSMVHSVILNTSLLALLTRYLLPSDLLCHYHPQHKEIQRRQHWVTLNYQQSRATLHFKMRLGLHKSWTVGGGGWKGSLAECFPPSTATKLWQKL